MMTWRSTMIAIILVLLGAALGERVTAQDDGDSGAASDNGLVLLSVDEARPAFFQALAPGDDPVTTNFATRLEVPLDDDQTQNVIYVAIENTGWSEGAVGLIGENSTRTKRMSRSNYGNGWEISCCVTTGMR